MKKIKTLISIFFCLSFTAVAQTDLAQALRAAGFEQVHINDDEDTLKVFFEHRNFRNPYASISYAIKISEKYAKQPLKFVPLFHNRPMGVYDGVNMSFQKVGRPDRKWLNEANSMRDYRFSFRLMPDFTADFGFYEEPIANRTNLILDTRIYLFRGLSLHTGLLIPINNTLDTRSMDPSLGPTHLSYFYSNSSRHFFLAHAGLFLSDRYGVEFQYRYAPLDHKLSLGLSGSLTGIYFFDENTMYKQPVQSWTGLMDLEWRLPITGLVAKATAGQFLFGDKGIRFDLLRQYGSIDFGFHFSKTDFGTAVGFQIAFPFFPGKLIRTRDFELRTTEEFRWEYSYFRLDPVGRNFRTGMPRLDDIVRQYQTTFIQDQRKEQLQR
ncbi:YjbH domain-containing protein [Aquiflexum sp. LQ15W]|uniref:YjbH domain-containing protein n=1 Tax=Cognataquiflexum nitidum TaxID=2922272 RepID=UPI001F13E300|nr:YjbH domain-containing protein [Cognataquiflexum nitidum]MCH6201366.1 YjbH domain-containing protein [Cognataquiflexum nitidum]